MMIYLTRLACVSYANMRSSIRDEWSELIVELCRCGNRNSIWGDYSARNRRGHLMEVKPSLLITSSKLPLIASATLLCYSPHPKLAHCLCYKYIMRPFRYYHVSPCHLFTIFYYTCASQTYMQLLLLKIIMRSHP